MFRCGFKTVTVVVCACVLLVAEDSPGAWLDVPFVKQSKEGCGAASIAMVMRYWQQQQGWPATANSDAEQILRALHSHSAHGIYASDMKAYFQRSGYRVFTFSGRWQDLQEHLKKGRPLIAALKPGPQSPFHYVVVAGVDAQQQVVLLNDPEERKLLKEDRARFEREWRATGNWTLLAVPETDSRKAN